MEHSRDQASILIVNVLGDVRRAIMTCLHTIRYFCDKLNSFHFCVSVDCKFSQRPLWFCVKYQWVKLPPKLEAHISKGQVEPC
jgi:hypothetical protein